MALTSPEAFCENYAAGVLLPDMSGEYCCRMGRTLIFTFPLPQVIPAGIRLLLVIAFPVAYTMVVSILLGLSSVRIGWQDGTFAACGTGNRYTWRYQMPRALHSPILLNVKLPTLESGR